MCMYIYIYICVYMCVRVCVYLRCGRPRIPQLCRDASRETCGCAQLKREFLRFFFGGASAPGVLRVGGTYDYASRLGPVRRLPTSNSPNGTSRASDGSMGPREQLQERQGAAADSPANFHAEDSQAGAPSLPQFRVSSVFAVGCLVEGEARLVVSPWAGLAIPSDWAHDCGIHRDLGSLPNGESIGDNLYAASVAGWYVKVEVTERDVRCDSAARSRGPARPLARRPSDGRRIAIACR